MEEQKSTTLLKSSLTSGIYLGLISILFSVIIWAGGIVESMGIFASAAIGLLSIVITFVLLLIFTINYRKKEWGNYISFGEAFKFAILAVVFSTMITAIYTFIFHKFIDPEYLQNVMAIMGQKTADYMASKGVPDSAIDEAMERFKDVPTIAKTIRQTLLNGLIVGAIISLIVALIARKKNEDDIQ